MMHYPDPAGPQIVLVHLCATELRAKCVFVFPRFNKHANRSFRDGGEAGKKEKPDVGGSSLIKQ